MKGLETVEIIEKNILECMNWMENNIREAIKALMYRNEEDLKHTGNNLYCEGFYDALVEIANELEIEID